jgi:hypothetical protein
MVWKATCAMEEQMRFVDAVVAPILCYHLSRSCDPFRQAEVSDLPRRSRVQLGFIIMLMRFSSLTGDIRLRGPTS